MRGLRATTAAFALAGFWTASPVGAQEIAPEVIGPGTISTDVNQTFPAIDPTTGDLWFSEYTRGFANQTIRLARTDGTGWSAPDTAPFSGTWGDRAPRFSPDGRTLYFTSNRPEGTGNDDIYRFEKRQLPPEPEKPDPQVVEYKLILEGYVLEKIGAIEEAVTNYKKSCDLKNTLGCTNLERLQSNKK